MQVASESNPRTLSPVIYPTARGAKSAAAVLMLAVLIPMGCGRSAEPVKNESSTVVDYEKLIARLRAKGADVAVTGEEISQPFLSVRGRDIEVNGKSVQVFEYQSEADVEADVKKVSPTGEIVGTTIITWVGQPHFYRTGRLLVIYIGDDRSITGILESILGAQFAGEQ